MDRAKYAHNQDYREGYDEGVKNGRREVKRQLGALYDTIETFKSMMEYILEEDEEDINDPCYGVPPEKRNFL